MINDAVSLRVGRTKTCIVTRNEYAADMAAVVESRKRWLFAVARLRGPDAERIANEGYHAVLFHLS